MGSIMLMAQARRIDTDMLADLLPMAEAAILAALHDKEPPNAD